MDVKLLDVAEDVHVEAHGADEAQEEVDGGGNTHGEGFGEEHVGGGEGHGEP